MTTEPRGLRLGDDSQAFEGTEPPQSSIAAEVRGARLVVRFEAAPGGWGEAGDSLLVIES